MEIETSVDGQSVRRSIVRLAERQHGVVARRQLVALGLRAGAIDKWVQRLRLHVVHRGVYAVGHSVLSMRARWMAAVLAVGDDAVLSHRAAAALWGVRRSSAIEITAPRLVRRRGILAHQASLPADELVIRAGIPVTTITRTIYDLAAVRPYHDVQAAANQAEHHQLTDPLPLAALVARHPHGRGAVTLKRLITESAIGTRMTRSDLEVAFLAFVDAHRLARPDATNTHVEAGGRLYEADVLYREARLIVELDGPGHRARNAFDRDRARDRALTAAGWRVVRVTERHLTVERRQLAADLAALMGGWRGPRSRAARGRP